MVKEAFDKSRAAANHSSGSKPRLAESIRFQTHARAAWHLNPRRAGPEDPIPQVPTQTTTRLRARPGLSAGE